MATDWVQGQTSPKQYQVKLNGVAVNLTGATVTLELYDPAGTAVTTTGDVTVPTPATGIVQYAPDAADLVALEGRYTARFKIVDSNGYIAYAPDGKADVWTVRTVTGR
jgi:BppU N-terminal domain